MSNLQPKAEARHGHAPNSVMAEPLRSSLRFQHKAKPHFFFRAGKLVCQYSKMRGRDYNRLLGKAYDFALTIGYGVWENSIPAGPTRQDPLGQQGYIVWSKYQ